MVLSPPPKRRLSNSFGDPLRSKRYRTDVKKEMRTKTKALTITDLPVELIWIIARNLVPLSLLTLYNSAKWFRNVLNPAVAETEWKAARNNLSIPLIDPPAHLNEVQFALFVFGEAERLCKVCRCQRILDATAWVWICSCDLKQIQHGDVIISSTFGFNLPLAHPIWRCAPRSYGNTSAYLSSIAGNMMPEVFEADGRSMYYRPHFLLVVNEYFKMHGNPGSQMAYVEWASRRATNAMMAGINLARWRIRFHEAETRIVERHMEEFRASLPKAIESLGKLRGKDAIFQNPKVVCTFPSVRRKARVLGDVSFSTWEILRMKDEIRVDAERFTKELDRRLVKTIIGQRPELRREIEDISDSPYAVFVCNSPTCSPKGTVLSYREVLSHACIIGASNLPLSWLPIASDIVDRALAKKNLPTGSKLSLLNIFGKCFICNCEWPHNAIPMDVTELVRHWLKEHLDFQLVRRSRYQCPRQVGFQRYHTMEHLSALVQALPSHVYHQKEDRTHCRTWC